MKEFTMDDIRRRMYSQQTKKKVSEKKSGTSIDAARNVVILEEGKQKIAVPTNDAFQKLLKEHQDMKREFKNAQTQIKTLTDGANILIKEINRLSDELNGKIDKVNDD